MSQRVGFVLSPGDWLGGRNYLKNLFAAIHTLPGNPIVPVIFTGRRQSGTTKDFPGIQIVESSILDRKSPLWFVRKIVSKTGLGDLLLQRLLRRHGVTILSHSSHLGRRTAITMIGWIPDFQHVHLPDFFTFQERAQRDREFRELCVYCDKIILSSECARSDLRKFAPEYASKAELLRFVAAPAPPTQASGLLDLQEIYNFSGPYFLLPNQFWAHKNHCVVLRALQELKHRNEHVLVLATGSSKDYRDPSFFRSLMAYAAECDVLDCFRVLGLTPYDHLVGLMQHTVAFINPSRFEGWSTSVEEAKSMGKQIILSDLPVHREQAPERGFYFPPEDHEALAAAMLSAIKAYDEVDDACRQTHAKARISIRQLQFGQEYDRILNDATGQNRAR